MIVPKGGGIIHVWSHPMRSLPSVTSPHLSPHPSKAFGYEQQIGYVLTLQFTVGLNCSTHYWACTWMEPSNINTYWILCQETDQTSITLLYYSYDPLIWALGCCASDEVKLEFNFHLWPALEQPVVSSLVFSLHWGLSSLLLLVPSFGKTEGFFTPNSGHFTDNFYIFKKCFNFPKQN